MRGHEAHDSTKSCMLPLACSPQRVSDRSEESLYAASFGSDSKTLRVNARVSTRGLGAFLYTYITVLSKYDLHGGSDAVRNWHGPDTSKLGQIKTAHT